MFIHTLEDTRFQNHHDAGEREKVILFDSRSKIISNHVIYSVPSELVHLILLKNVSS